MLPRHKHKMDGERDILKIRRDVFELGARGSCRASSLCAGLIPPGKRESVVEKHKVPRRESSHA